MRCACARRSSFRISAKSTISPISRRSSAASPASEDEWVYMHRGLGIPGRVKTDANGTITAPATDEAFMREYIKEWKRLMKATPNLAVQREP